MISSVVPSHTLTRIRLPFHWFLFLVFSRQILSSDYAQWASWLATPPASWCICDIVLNQRSSKTKIDYVARWRAYRSNLMWLVFFNFLIHDFTSADYFCQQFRLSHPHFRRVKPTPAALVDLVSADRNLLQ